MLFGKAKIAGFDNINRMAYKESLKIYRHIKNVTDTAHEERHREAEAVYT